MSSQDRRFRPTGAFVGHLALFLTVTLGLIVLTLVSGGGFWWYPIMLIWGVMVAIHGISDYWRWRRDPWETGFDDREFSQEQQDERDWDRRASGFRGFGAS